MIYSDDEVSEMFKMRAEDWNDYFNNKVWPELLNGIGYTSEKLMFEVAIGFIKEDLENNEFKDLNEKYE